MYFTGLNSIYSLNRQLIDFRSPTHAGGLFAIRRDWFEQLGYYDDGLQIWGGENFELSFKVWNLLFRIEKMVVHVVFTVFTYIHLYVFFVILFGSC